MNALKERFRRGERLFGTHITLTDPAITELTAMMGFDFLWVDTEHTAIGYENLLAHLIAARAGGTPTLVRVPWNDAVLAKRVLEMGPDGIIFPMVNSAEECRAAMASTLYPPLGTRGFGPIRAIRYGLDDAAAYVADDENAMCRFVQVEHIDAVRELDAIAATPGLDGFILGPCDLSGSLGRLLRVFDPEVVDAIAGSVACAHAHGLPIGLSTGAMDAETLRFWRDKGVDFISAGTATQCIIDGLSGMRTRFSMTGA